MSDSGSDSEIRCNACGFEASYVPEGMLSCEHCNEAQYCSSHCLQWDWKSGGHDKVCSGQRKGSYKADVPPAQTSTSNKRAQSDTLKGEADESGSAEYMEEEVSSQDSGTLVSMEVGQVFQQEPAAPVKRTETKTRAESPSQTKGSSLGTYLASTSPTRASKHSIPAPPPPPPPAPVTVPDHSSPEEGMLEDSIQQDTLFEDEREGSDQETVDEALTCISEEDSKHFQGEPDHEGSWRRRDHFTVKAAAKPTLGTLGVTEEVDSETESTEFFGHQQTLGNRGQASATSSEDDFYQGEYGSSSTSGSDDSSGEDADEDEEMEMLENVDAYMEAASATPSKRSATDDKSSAGSKRAKEQGHVEPQQEEKQQPEAKIQISPASKRSSYKDFRDAYSAGDADALETSSSLKKFRELYDQDDAIPEDDETLTTLRSMEKEMESISAAGSTDDAIAAKKEALKKSINTALRDLEKIHGEEAAQAIFLRLTQNLDGIDTETLSKELSGSGIDKGSPSSANSALSDNENLENTEPAISPIEPSATSTGTLRTVSTSEAETENNSMSSTSKDGRASGIPRYMQYRNSLLSPDKSSKASSQSSSQVSEVVTPDNDPSSSTSESIAPRPTSIPRYMQYRSSLAKDLSSGSGSDGIEAKGFDADTAAGVPMATKDDKEDTNRTVKSTEMPRYMQYRDSLRKNSSLSTMAADTTVVKARPSETTSASAPFLGDVEVVPTISKDDQTTASIRHDTKTADSQSPFVPRFMQYRTAFNRETDNAFPSSEKTESVDPSRAATLSTNAGRVPSASAVIEFGTSTSNITTEDGTDVVAPVASMSPTVSDTAPDSTNQPDTSSMPRYTQYRNRLAKRTSPGSGTDDAVGEDGGGSDKSRTGIVAAAAVASVGAAAVTAGVMSSTNDGKSGPTASTLPRYMQYRTTLSKNTASLPGAGTEPSASRSEVTPPPSASVSNMSGMGPSSTPRYLQYRETLSNSTVAKEAVAEKSVAATVKSISPTDSGTTPDFINQTDTSSMPRYMKYRNTLAKKNDPTSGTDDAVGKNEGGFANNRTGVVAAAAVASIGAAAAMSSTNDGNSEPTASTSPQYMQYRSALATGTGSKAPASTTDLEDPSMSESDNSMESQPDISVPDDLANRNSRHLADSESSSEEDLDQDISAANDDVPVAVISSTANSVRSEAAEPDMQTSAQVIVGPGPSTSTDEGLTIQELNRRRIAATIARVTAQSGVSLGPKASLNDAPPKQDLKQQPIAPEVSTATTHENVEPSPNASSVEPPPIQDLNRQRIAATISRAMSQNKGEKRPSIMEKRPKQNKTNPLQEQAHEVGDKQVEVAGPILAASPPPPAIPDSAAALSATLPPQPGSSGPTELAGSNDNARKSQLMHHPAPRKRRQSFLYALLILFLVAAPLSIGLAVSQRNKDAPSPPALGTDSPTSAPSPLLRSRAPATTPPTPLDPNPSPVASPSSDPPTDLSPVASPTPGIASPTRVPERAELFDLLSSVSSDGGVNIATPGTPQYDAFNWLANDPNVTTLPGEKLIQRYSLATFYYSTNGGNWTSSQGWLTEEDECAWFTRSTRIPVCDDGGVFQNLDLGFNEVGGSIPAELALLSNLLRVGLSGGTTQRISGPLPVELGSLTNLVTFDVFGNALTGSIPPELGAWTDVELMNMGFNRLSGSLPNTFQSMTSLMELDCGLNFLTGSIPSTLSNLASLEKLILNNNELNGAVQVSGLSELRELNVEGNAFTSVGSSLGNLSNLQTLRLNNNALTGPILGNIGNLTNLITLDMSRNGLSGAIPTQIGMLTNLRNLHLSSNSLEGTIPTQIGMLNGLLNLLLQSNKLTGSIPDEISQLKRLTTIRLEENIIQGSVSTTVCDAFTTTRPIFYLDCGGDSPEVTCPPGSECCTFCCTTEGGCQCELEGTSSEFLCG